MIVKNYFRKTSKGSVEVNLKDILKEDEDNVEYNAK